jgi:hypothetical protein
MAVVFGVIGKATPAELDEMDGASRIAASQQPGFKQLPAFISGKRRGQRCL